MTQKVSFDAAWPKIDAVPGWLSPGQERCLFDLVNRLPNDARILEVGCFLGRSTASMGSACLGTNRQIVCIDTFEGNDNDFVKGNNEVAWEGDDFFSAFDANIRGAGVRKHVLPLRGLSTYFAKSWCEPLDMLFIDAGHQFDDVLLDFETYAPFVKPGGIVAMHDITPGWPDCYKVWHEHAAPTLTDHGNSGSLAYGVQKG